MHHRRRRIVIISLPASFSSSIALAPIAKKPVQSIAKRNCVTTEDAINRANPKSKKKKIQSCAICFVPGHNSTSCTQKLSYEPLGGNASSSQGIFSEACKKVLFEGTK